MSVIVAYDTEGDEFIVPRDKVLIKQTSSTETIKDSGGITGIPVVNRRYWAKALGESDTLQTGIWELSKEMYEDIKEKILNVPDNDDIICEVKNNKEGEKG